MSLAALLIRLAGIGLVIGSIFSAGAYVEKMHRDRLDDRRIAQEAQKEHDRIVGIDREKEADDHAAAAASMFFEAERQKREVAYANAQRQLSAALKRPASCPAGGTLGDVVIPADALVGLRTASGQDGVLAPQRAASESIR